MLRASCFLSSFQYPLTYLLSLSHLTLTLIEITQVINKIEYEYTLKVLYFLSFFQYSLLYLLNLNYLTLIKIEIV